MQEAIEACTSILEHFAFRHDFGLGIIYTCLLVPDNPPPSGRDACSGLARPDRADFSVL